MSRIEPRQPDADFRMMNSPDDWPIFPLLALKHKTEKSGGSWPRMGVLICLSTRRDFPMMFFADKTIYDSLVTAQATAKIDDADDLRKLVNEGWIVD